LTAKILAQAEQAPAPLSRLRVTEPRIQRVAGRLEASRDVIRKQAGAVLALVSRIDDNFAQALDLILETEGHVIVVGMGKSGLIGQKIAATLASTGTPSFAVHPGEAYHGDLGMIRPCDLVLMLSYSGETEEVIRLLPSLRRNSVKIVAMVGQPNSRLSRDADVTLDVSVDSEVCPNNLAPTNSTLAAMAMGDALAVALMRERNFGPRDFACFHPGGSLGRRLLTRVGDAMHVNNLPFVNATDTVQETLFAVSRGRLGLALVLNKGRLVGLVTDGDLRRGVQDGTAVFEHSTESIMTPEPQTVNADTLLEDAQATMHKWRISALVVVDRDGRVEGVLDIYCR